MLRVLAETLRRWTTALGARPRVVSLLIVVIAVLIFTEIGSRRIQHGPDSGDRLNWASTVEAPTGRRLRIATFNIHRAKGTDGRRDLRRTADSLAEVGPDFVALQEVYGERLGRHSNQAEALASMLNMAWLYAPSEERWWHLDFGNAILSRLNVVHWQRIPLVRAGAKGHRHAILAVAEHHDQRIHIVLTHIDRGDDEARRRQLRSVSELFLSLREPAILMGDLNTPPEDPQIERLLNDPSVEEPLRAKYGDAARRTIDWILVRGLRCVDADLVHRGASDHPLLWADVELPAYRQAQPLTAQSGDLPATRASDNGRGADVRR